MRSKVFSAADIRRVALLAWLSFGGCSDGALRHADTGADASSSGDAGHDGGCPADAGADTSDAGEIDICTCLRESEYRACRPAPTTSCSVPEDCCDAGSPIPCGYFGNRFACVTGLCRAEGCTSHSECRTYAESSGLPDADAYGCLDPVCGVGTPTCGIGARECDAERDCCLEGTDLPCGEYGNRWRCSNQRCSNRPCECDADCAVYATTLGLPRPDAWTCVAPLCGDFRTCVERRPCLEASDCCDAESAVPCGLFGNRHVCHGGQCFEDGCDADEECVAWATAEGLPLAETYTCP